MAENYRFAGNNLQRFGRWAAQRLLPGDQRGPGGRLQRVGRGAAALVGRVGAGLVGGGIAGGLAGRAGANWVNNGNPLDMSRPDVPTGAEGGLASALSAYAGQPIQGNASHFMPQRAPNGFSNGIFAGGQGNFGPQTNNPAQLAAPQGVFAGGSGNFGPEMRQAPPIPSRDRRSGNTTRSSVAWSRDGGGSFSGGGEWAYQAGLQGQARAAMAGMFRDAQQ